MTLKFPYYIKQLIDWKFYDHPAQIIRNMWSDLKPIELHKIKVYPFPEKDYFEEEFEKKQVVLHHTVSGPGIEGDINTWEGEPGIATCIIIDRDGTPFQLFSSKYWAYHLGVSANNHFLHKHTIGVEIDNWGCLVLGDGKERKFGAKTVQTKPGVFYNYYGQETKTEIEYYPDKFRGYEYYEKYTDSQIQTAGELLLFWNKKYNIPLKYNRDMWDYSERAMNGEAGIWTHVSYRKDKSDCHPQPELIEMLRTISTL